MSIHITVTERMFINEMEAVRPGQFSRRALSVIFDYLNEMESDYEFDAIGICCSYVEKTSREVIADYDVASFTGACAGDTEALIASLESQMDQENFDAMAEEFLIDQTTICGDFLNDAGDRVWVFLEF